MEEVTGEPLYRDRVCGIDIGKAQMVATIRVPPDRDPARRAAQTRTFGTAKREVLALADWLRCWRVPAVVMEAMPDYWKSPFCRLEAEGLECVLAVAKQVKNLPGRPKRDPADPRWLAATPVARAGESRRTEACASDPASENARNSISSVLPRSVGGSQGNYTLPTRGGVRPEPGEGPAFRFVLLSALCGRCPWLSVGAGSRKPDGTDI